MKSSNVYFYYIIIVLVRVIYFKYNALRMFNSFGLELFIFVNLILNSRFLHLLINEFYSIFKSIIDFI